MRMQSRTEQIELEAERLRTFQLKADHISHLILNTDLPWIDIVIQIEKLRNLAQEMFRGKSELFELIYVSRFKRLWQQWRSEEPDAPARGEG